MSGSRQGCDRAAKVVELGTLVSPESELQIVDALSALQCAPIAVSAGWHAHCGLWCHVWLMSGARAVTGLPWRWSLALWCFQSWSCRSSTPSALSSAPQQLDLQGSMTMGVCGVVFG